MKCSKCGKIMVEIDPNQMNASNPPSVWMICKCGHRDLKLSGYLVEEPKTWKERWDEKNK